MNVHWSDAVQFAALFCSLQTLKLDHWNRDTVHPVIEMNFLPLVQRELLVGSRRAATYSLRFWVSVVVSAVTLGMVIAIRIPVWELAALISSTLGGLAFFYCLFSGVLFTSDCISEERRDGTLGIFFLTKLKGHDVVLGKLASSSLNAFYGLLAIFPLLNLPLVFGGTTLSEFFRMTLALIATLFFSLATGMFVSLFGDSARQTMLRTIFALLLVTFGFPLVALITSKAIQSSAFERCLLLLSPAYLFGLHAAGGQQYWRSILAVTGLAASSIATANWLLPYRFRDARPLIGSATWSRRIHRWRFARLPRRSIWMNESVPINPCVWLAGRNRVPNLILWALALSAIVGGWSAYSTLPFNWFKEVLCTVAAMHLLLKLGVAMEACRRINDDRRSGAFELLLTTRLSIAEIISGHRAALMKLLWPLVTTTILLTLLTMAWMNEFTTKRDLIWILLGGILVLPLDIHALIWVGSALSLRGNRYHKTVIATLGRVLLPPALGFAVLFLLFFGNHLYIFGAGMSLQGLWLLVACWIFAVVLSDSFLVIWAKIEITHETRSPRYLLNPSSNEHIPQPFSAPLKY